MATEFVGPHPWTQITKSGRTKGPRYAAIAYLSDESETLLILKKGDVLVVNSGKAALRGHATSPDALEFFLDRGVHVYSLPTLHAKVIATQRMAVVGSANASANSTKVAEASVITDNKRLIAEVTRFVKDRVAESTRVDSVFIELARKEWAKGRSTRLPGIDDETTAEKPFIDGKERMFLAIMELYKPSQTALDFAEAVLVDSREARGPAAKFELDWYMEPAETGAGVGDVEFHVMEEDGEVWLFPPCVVVSDELELPYGRGKVMQVTKHQKGLDPIMTIDARERLKKAGIVRPNLHTDHEIHSADLRRELLKLFGL